jgi:hypothetical protein
VSLPTHNGLCEKIAALLKERPYTWYFRPVNTGYGRLGIPDFICCHRGRMYGIEVKVGRDKPSPWQQRELMAIALAGGEARVVRSLKEMMAILDESDAL